MRRFKHRRWWLLLAVVVLAGGAFFAFWHSAETRFWPTWLGDERPEAVINDVRQHAVMTATNRHAWIAKYGTPQKVAARIHNLTDLRAAVAEANPHSSVYLPGEARDITRPTVVTEQGYEWIDLPSFWPNSFKEPSVIVYINTVNRAVQKAQGGIIIDLRNNYGGSPQVMIMAVAALVPQGDIFSLVPKNGPAQPWTLQNQGIVANGSGGDQLTLDKPFPKRTGLKAAVLVSKRTASAAEFTALALRNNPKVKIFGTPTGGFLSGNVGQSYSYLGHTLIVSMTTSWAKDNAGKVYHEDPIYPDKILPANDQQALSKAVFDWLNAK
ncbi:MAG: S41 family peptidase [Schleiferilactobacillus perolens]|uniref:S41 family peptidase n=1 Tax=Schleiferilactobacillus perolens TaxID=100468 RepID=UPI0039EADCAA